MKTQIITLESHDDLISVRDRMSWAKSRRILLVWPGYERVALRPVDLRVLQEHANLLGAELGLVTRRGEIRREAEGFKIPVFASTVEAQRHPWPRRSFPLRRRRTGGAAPVVRLQALRDEARMRSAGGKSSVVVRIGSFVLGVLAVLALTAVFVPRATITLSPTSKEQTLLLPVMASTTIQAVAVNGSVPARELAVTVGGTQSAKVTSQAAIPHDQAAGMARFVNLTQTEQVIPAGTVVYSITPASERFATVNEARLPASVNAVVDAPIIAVNSGAAGNVPANSIQAVEGGLGASVSVTNPEPTAGGADRMTTVPNQEDRTHLREALLAVLEEQAKEKIQGSIGQSDILLPNTLTAAQVVEEKYDPAAGDPGSVLQLSMSVEYTAQYVRADDLKSLAQAALKASVPAGFRASAGSLTFSLSGTPVVDESGASRFDLQVHQKLVRDVDLFQAAAMVRGAPPLTAARLLQARLPLDRPPEIQLSPSWWPWLPLIPFRITLTAS